MDSSLKLVQRRFETRLKPIVGFPPFFCFINLCIILVLCSQLSAFKKVNAFGIKVDLPVATSVASHELDGDIVTIVNKNSDGYDIFFNDEKIQDLKSLPLKFSENEEQNAKKVIIIRADSSVNFEIVAQVMAMAEERKMSTFVVINADRTPTSFETE